MGAHRFKIIDARQCSQAKALPHARAVKKARVLARRCIRLARPEVVCLDHAAMKASGPLLQSCSWCQWSPVAASYRTHQAKAIHMTASWIISLDLQHAACQHLACCKQPLSAALTAAAAS